MRLKYTFTNLQISPELQPTAEDVRLHGHALLGSETEL